MEPEFLFASVPLTGLAHVSLEAYLPWPGRMRSPNWPGLDFRGTINPMTKNDLKKKSQSEKGCSKKGQGTMTNNTR